MKHLVCFHLLNDYSGSPKILKIVLQGLLDRGYRIDLISSRTGGILDELTGYPDLKRTSYRYHFSSNPVWTMFNYSCVQLYTFVLSFRYFFRKDVVFFINTLLPIGPALAGWLMGKRVVYHYHENAFVKGILYRTLCKCMECIASEIVCVSQYQRSFLKRTTGVHVVHDTLPKEFVSGIVPNMENAFACKTVLMLSSLKRYKGVLEFIDLARRLPQYRFNLVINDTQACIDLFMAENSVVPTGNLHIYPRHNDVIPFYQKASLLLSLSNKKLFIETFGLTALEAMTAGLPIIVPTEGGIAELVQDGVNGYKIDVDKPDEIERQINRILSEPALYKTLSENAILKSRQYDADKMVCHIKELLDK